MRKIRQGAFQECAKLTHVELSDGLEVLGTHEYAEDGKDYCGVFEGSSLPTIRLPTTLKAIEYRAFCNCKQLVHVSLP